MRRLPPRFDNFLMGGAARSPTAGVRDLSSSGTYSAPHEESTSSSVGAASSTTAGTSHASFAAEAAASPSGGGESLARASSLATSFRLRRSALPASRLLRAASCVDGLPHDLSSSFSALAHRPQHAPPHFAAPAAKTSVWSLVSEQAFLRIAEVHRIAAAACRNRIRVVGRGAVPGPSARLARGLYPARPTGGAHRSNPSIAAGPLPAASPATSTVVAHAPPTPLPSPPSPAPPALLPATPPPPQAAAVRHALLDIRGRIYVDSRLGDRSEEVVRHRKIMLLIRKAQETSSLAVPPLHWWADDERYRQLVRVWARSLAPMRW